MSGHREGVATRRLEPRLAAVLAYMLGIITGIILLRAERKDRFVRFHALQSILFSSVVLVMLMLLVGVGFELFLAIAAWAVWAILMLRAARGEFFQLPLIGRWAEANA